MSDFIFNNLDLFFVYFNELSTLPHTLMLITLIMVPLLVLVAYYTYAERKIIA